MVHEQPLNSAEAAPQPSIPLSLNDFDLIPYAEINGRFNLPDEFLKAIFYGHKEEIDLVFWRDSMRSFEDFEAFAKSDGNLLVFVFKSGVPAGFGWLTQISERHAFAHFLFVKKFWGDVEDAGRLLENYWFGLNLDGETILDTLLGMIPGHNKMAQSFIKRLGWTHLGDIPKMLSGKDDKRADAAIFFQQRL